VLCSGLPLSMFADESKKVLEAHVEALWLQKAASRLHDYGDTAVDKLRFERHVFGAQRGGKARGCWASSSTSAEGTEDSQWSRRGTGDV
jgi:hypothetical protein